MTNKTILLITLLFLTAGVSAQNSVSMSLVQAQDYAAEHSYVLKGAQYDAEAARRQVKETVAIGLPQINASIDYNNFIDIPTQVAPADAFGFPAYLTDFLVGVSQETEVPLNAPETDPNAISEFQFGAPQTMNAGISASQLIFDGSYFVGLKAARTYVEVMNGAVEISEHNVRAQVAEAYNTALVARQNAQLLSNSRDILVDSRNETQALFDNGFAEEEDIDQLDLAIADIDNRIQNANNQERVALDLLKFQMGMPISTDLTLSDSVESLMTGSTAKLMGAPFDPKQTRNYKVLNTRVTLMQLNEKNEKAKALPSIGAFYNYQRQAQRDEFNFLDGDQKWYPFQVWGVQFSMPLFTSLRGHQRIQQAHVEVERAKTDLEQAVNATDLEYQTAKNDYQFALTNYQNQENSLALAEKIFNKTEIKYKEGVAGSFDLIQAKNQLISAQGSFIQATLTLLNTKTQLQKVLNQ